MKLVIISSLLAISIWPVNKQLTSNASNLNLPGKATLIGNNKKDVMLSFSSQPSAEGVNMLAVVFKSREYCRAELKDFEYDVKFSIVGASVYFSGTNFRGVEKATINSNSFKPIRSYIERCAPGSVVIFDDVKVVGPDKQIRTIEGKTYLLH